MIFNYPKKLESNQLIQKINSRPMNKLRFPILSFVLNTNNIAYSSKLSTALQAYWPNVGYLADKSVKDLFKTLEYIEEDDSEVVLLFKAEDYNLDYINELLELKNIKYILLVDDGYLQINKFPEQLKSKIVLFFTTLDYYYSFARFYLATDISEYFKKELIGLRELLELTEFNTIVNSDSIGIISFEDKYKVKEVITIEKFLYSLTINDFKLENIEMILSEDLVITS